MSIYNQILENKLKELAKGGSATPTAQKSRFDTPSSEAAQAKVNNFKNDGSFLEQFRRMQSLKSQLSLSFVRAAAGGVQFKAEASQDSSSSSQQETAVGQPPKTEPPKNVGAGTSQPTGLVIKLQAPQPTKTLLPSAVAAKLKGDDDDDDEEEAAPLKEGKAVQGAIERVAICVAINGRSAEEAARVAHVDDPAYEFLRNKDGEEYHRFQERVQALSAAKLRAEESGALPPSSRIG
ncbi:hypothetical protein MRX96_004723 [Rhipicephalus microplus]